MKTSYKNLRHSELVNNSTGTTSSNLESTYHKSQGKSVMMLLNIQGLTPDALSRQLWKIPYLRNLVPSTNFHYLFIAITESRLKPCNSEAQIQINNYNTFKSDRKNRDCGGVLLYIRTDIPLTKSDTYDDDTCEGVFCVSDPLKLIIVCLYKPCNASDKSFT